jgi:UDP-glucose 4-epimerase
MAVYLVTGGCGFIGSHLVDALLAAGHGVRNLDDLSTGQRANVPADAEVIVGDVADQRSVEAAMGGVDGCFHLAAIASVQKGLEDWVGTHRVNLGGAIHVFDAARRARAASPPAVAVPVVYASSAAVYGDNPDVPLVEAAALGPISAYGADKLGCELHARVAAETHGVPATGLRFFNVFGPRQDPSSAYSGVISIFADRIARGEAVTIFGDGGQTRDFVYVGDVVEALRAAMDALDPAAPAHAVYNVCTGRAISVADLAAAIGAIRGTAPRIQHAPARAGDIRASIGDGAKAAAALGFEAHTTLADGLAATLSALADGRWSVSCSS